MRNDIEWPRKLMSNAQKRGYLRAMHGRAVLARLLKTLVCPACNTEFKQRSISQRFCCRACAAEPRPWQPAVKAVIDQFEQFCERHQIPRLAVVSSRAWQRIVRDTTRRDPATDTQRAELAKKLKVILDRFRRGYYRFDPKIGVYFQNPPDQPFCPIDHTYCRGAILSGDCPRQMRDCVYSRARQFTRYQETWREILKLRGIYAFVVGQNGQRSFDRVRFRPLVTTSGERDHERYQPHARRIDSASHTGKDQRGVAANRQGV